MTRVLLVDDDEDSTELMQLLLSRRGFEVTTAVSVASAIAAAEAGTHDVLLSDIGLPDGTGHELLEKLRATGRLPAIALTGLDPSNAAKGKGDEAFDEYMRKPVAIEKLVDALRRVCGSAP